MSVQSSWARRVARIRARLARHFRALVVAVAPFASLASVVSADEYQLLFQRTLRQPTDVDAAFAFVGASEDRHDYEAAIGTLERLLLFNTGSAAVQAQLGMLYYRLRSFDMASHYFGLALANPLLDATSREQVSSLSASTARLASPSQLTGFVQSGARYQSNASFNSESNIIRLAGQDFAIGNPQRKGPDGSAFVLGQIQHNYDLGNQRGDSLETLASTYYARQFRFTDLSVGFADLSFGPRLALGASGWSVKPYIAGGQVWLGRSRYLTSAGGGIAVDAQFTPDLHLQQSAEVRRTVFNNVPVYSDLNSGVNLSMTTTGTIRLNEYLSALARISFNRGLANNTYQTFNAISGDIGFTGTFAAPFGLNTQWGLSPYARLIQTDFDGANPFIDQNRVQRDREYTFGLTLDAPLSPSVSIAATVQYSRVTSTIPNFATRDLSFISGPVVHF